MPGLPASITIGIDPTIELGPITLAWHGLTIAIGIAIGGIVAGRLIQGRGPPAEPLQVIAIILVVSALIGSRISISQSTISCWSRPSGSGRTDSRSTAV